MYSFTSLADEFRKQSEELQFSDYYPPFSNSYDVLLNQQDLLLKAQEMENSVRMIRSRFEEIANSSPKIPDSTLLRKAIVSVRKEKIGFSADQLEGVVALIMQKFPYILFKPKSKSKDYVVVLFWSSSINDQDCHIQAEATVIQKEIAVDLYELRFAVENVCNAKPQFFYLINNFRCVKVQNDDVYKLTSENHKQLQFFIEMIQSSSRKRKAETMRKAVLNFLNSK